MTVSHNAKWNKEVPDIVVSRLPIYLRSLYILAGEGKEITSSQELAARLGLSSAQIRKDLSHFGEFGKQGTGYNIQFLRERLEHILNLGAVWPVALVGFGDLGHALVHYAGFVRKGFEIQAVFDNAPHKVGHRINSTLIIEDVSKIKESVRAKGIKIAILAVPLEVAPGITDVLIEAGIKAILNYAPTTLTVPSNVKVQNIDPIVYLQNMTYYL